MEKILSNTLKDKHVALVCSGGVTKATAWHLGVALALEDQGLNFKTQKSSADIIDKAHINTYVGSSAGTLLCIWLTQGYLPYEILEAFVSPKTSRLKAITYKDMLSFKRNQKEKSGGKNFNMFENFPFFIQKMLSPSLNIAGICSTQGLADYLRREVVTEDRFDELNPDLFIIGTKLDSSQKVIFGKYNYPSPPYNQDSIYRCGQSIIDAAAASMSVPPFYGPFPIKNPESGKIEYFIDGEIRETLSTHVAIDNKCDFIISSWTHAPYQYHNQIGSLINYGLPAISLQSILLMVEKKIKAHRNRLKMKKITLDSVHEYMKKEKFGDHHIKDILNILEQKLDYRPDVKFLDICPRENDYELFFSSTFSINVKVTSRIVRKAYKRTLQVLKEYEW